MLFAHWIKRYLMLDFARTVTSVYTSYRITNSTICAMWQHKKNPNISQIFKYIASKISCRATESFIITKWGIRIPQKVLRFKYFFFYPFLKLYKPANIFIPFCLVSSASCYNVLNSISSVYLILCPSRRKALKVGTMIIILSHFSYFSNKSLHIMQYFKFFNVISWKNHLTKMEFI